MFGTVCDDGSTYTNAEVVCKQLGFLGVITFGNIYGAGTGQIWLGDISCLGTEPSLMNCTNNGWGNHNCAHSEDISVVMYDRLGRDREHNVVSEVKEYGRGYGKLPENELGCKLFSKNAGQRANDNASNARETMNEIVSDNGPQFNSENFRRFMEQYGFKHTSSSPNYPQGNGQAERTVQTVKNILRKNKDPHRAILDYRNTPLDIGRSPAQMFLGRRLKAFLPATAKVLLPIAHNLNIPLMLKKRQELSKRYYDRRSGRDLRNRKHIRKVPNHDYAVTEELIDSFSERETEQSQNITDNKGQETSASVTRRPSTRSGPTSVSVRIADGDEYSFGRIEVHYNNTWGTICQKGFTIESADVICKQLGFMNAAVNFLNGNYYGLERGKVWLSHVSCRGDESNVATCPHSYSGKTSCNHDEDISIICDNSILK
ncbi:Soluble scavenger receptor cysteine-rich domain-containing protein SSC5D [Trichoplax sp. H2]|nr:Soluble scavenger receptor cysteine-rich domain-containing protein SSC5D [Trichoplax sp. H2]|eukprot:RDD39052.1 Soluble scavenger receptor cysteine-rich domain-containing protein SSC5D [Trichoplax sp. H2]